MTGAASEDRARLRRAARLSAVQALYQMEVAGTGATEVVRQFRDHRFGHAGEPGDYLEADEDFFEDLLHGVVAAQDRVDEAIGGTLREDWKLSRLDATLRAVLRAGAYELLERADVPAKVVINEYVDVAHAFFEKSEPGFVNASLEAFARKVRADEFAAKE
ncbi:transcription antitermination factor NusB [Marinicauda salina]|uniref:Transcription antitermination protein NusB n=1 Tax=Marinicauda salina TaxID=2135793 RepID=A0A2U2BVH4_9PROT|nr:transcription antitermination factor NusB [Marinicauda salina]PWE17990.1 transcription antitermination factor NusB [Marinicauda salina]